MKHLATIALMTVIAVGFSGQVAAQIEPGPLTKARIAFDGHKELSSQIVKRDYDQLLAVSKEIHKGEQNSLVPAMVKILKKHELPEEGGVESFLLAVWLDLRFGDRAIQRGNDMKRDDILKSANRLIPVTFSTEPTGATFWLHDETIAIGETDSEFWVSPGKVRVFIKCDGYEKVDELVEFSATKRSFTKKLAPLAK